MSATIADVLSGAARWCVVEGDSLALLQTLPDASVDHVITDPPYSHEHTHSKARRSGVSAPSLDGSGRTVACSGSRTAALGFDAITQGERLAVSSLVKRLCKRWALVFSDIEFSHAWTDSLRSAGLDYCRTGVWVKLNATPQFTGDRPASGVEGITIAHAKGRKRWNGGGTHAVWTHAIELNRGGGTPRLHTTQKPLPLMSEIVELFTDANNVILDPFAGSGTTGVAALRLGRRFIGIERDPKYAAVARERLAAEEAGSTLAARRAGQVAMFGGDQ